MNGGGGALFNDDPSVETIAAIGGGASPLRHDGLPADPDQRRFLGRRARHRRGRRGDRQRRARRARHPHRRPVPQQHARAGSTSRRCCSRSTTGPSSCCARCAQWPDAGDARAGVHHAGADPPAGRRPALSSRPATPTPTMKPSAPRSTPALTGFTHLFNAMSPAHQPRARRWSARRSRIGDLVRDHRRRPPCPPGDASASALQAKGTDRLMLVTDAMPTVGAEHQDSCFRAARSARRRQAAQPGWSPRRLDADDGQAVANAIDQGRLDLPSARRMASARRRASSGLRVRRAPSRRACAPIWSR